MKEYLTNEIKSVNWQIKGYRNLIENLQTRYDRAIENGDNELAYRIKSQMAGAKCQITRLNRKLNDLRRELRYMDVSDDYSIHGATIDKVLDGSIVIRHERDID